MGCIRDLVEVPIEGECEAWSETLRECDKALLEAEVLTDGVLVYNVVVFDCESMVTLECVNLEAALILFAAIADRSGTD